MRGFALVAAALLAAAAGAQAPRPLADLQAAARGGDAAAQFQLGEAYRTGTGAAIDRDQAIIWLRRAADQGNLPARDALGMLLFTRGNRQEAMPLIEAAAARGDARALYILATARFNGDYVARDWPRAFAEMSRAAELGLPQAKSSLTQMEPYLLSADRAKADQIRATLAAVAPPAGNVPAAAPAPPPPLAVIPAPPPRPIVALPTPPRSVDRPLPPTPLPLPAATKVAIAPPPPPPPARVAASPLKPAARGDWRVQLGAYGSRDRAETQWRALAGKVPALAGQERLLTPVGAMVRLQAGGIAGHDAADALCRKVVAAGGACFVVAP